VNGVILSPLPKLGTMGSKRGEARVTGLSTSYPLINFYLPEYMN